MQEYTPNRYGRMRKRRKLSSPAEQPSDRRRTPAADPDATKEYDPHWAYSIIALVRSCCKEKIKPNDLFCKPVLSGRVFISSSGTFVGLLENTNAANKKLFYSLL